MSFIVSEQIVWVIYWTHMLRSQLIHLPAKVTKAWASCDHHITAVVYHPKSSVTLANATNYYGTRQKTSSAAKLYPKHWLYRYIYVICWT